MRILLEIRLLAISLLTVLVIAACQNQTNQSSGDTASSLLSRPTDCRTIEHKMGALEICGYPQRIIVLGPYVLEPLLALNIQPVGFADHIAFHQGNYTDPSKQIPYLGNRITQPLANVGTAYTPSIEAVIKAQPDFIIGTEGNASQYPALSEIAPTLLLNHHDARGNLRMIAKAVNRSEQAAQLLDQKAQRIAEARETFTPLVATYPKVTLLRSSKLQEVSLASSTGLCPSLIEALGFQLVFPPGMTKDGSGTAKLISLETLPQLNDADLVILLGHNFSDLNQLDSMDRFEEHQLSNLKQAWETNAIAQSLDASKAGRVYFIPAYLCRGLPGPIGTELYLEELKEQLLTPD